DLTDIVGKVTIHLSQRIDRVFLRPQKVVIARDFEISDLRLKIIGLFFSHQTSGEQSLALVLQSLNLQIIVPSCLLLNLLESVGHSHCNSLTLFIGHEVVDITKSSISEVAGRRCHRLGTISDGLHLAASLVRSLLKLFFSVTRSVALTTITRGCPL